MFIARVSYGRTIREFILSVLLVPTFITFLWITIFGNTALNIEMFGNGGIAKVVQDNIPISLFVMLENFPLSGVTCFLGVVVVMTFFITSSDSGSMVIDIITSGGDPNPPVLSRLFWAILEGVVAAVLLAGGGLVALQTATITTGLPFALILLGLCYSLYKGLKEYTGPQEFSMDLSKKPSQFRLKNKPLSKAKTFGRRSLW
jgi:choline/glycine/proline betaine transport protein